MPDPAWMIGTATLSLIVNATVLQRLQRFRHGEVNLRATWIFTRADVVANLGVIVAGGLLAFTRSRIPDLVIGAAIALYVLKEAIEILREARVRRRDLPSHDNGPASRPHWSLDRRSWLGSGRLGGRGLVSVVYITLMGGM